MLTSPRPDHPLREGEAQVGTRVWHRSGFRAGRLTYVDWPELRVRWDDDPTRTHRIWRWVLGVAGAGPTS